MSSRRITGINISQSTGSDIRIVITIEVADVEVRPDAEFEAVPATGRIQLTILVVADKTWIGQCIYAGTGK